MPVITNSMIHLDLQKKARAIKTAKTFSIKRTKLLKLLCRLLRGRHSRKMRYEQKHITRQDGTKLRICVYTPHKMKENVPGLLWIHGGGYSIGIPEQDDSYILRFVEASGCVVVAPDYTLSIDKPYPAALEDCYAALLWLRDNGGSYGMCPEQIFIGGTSAGGGLAAAVSHYARDKAEIKLAFQILIYPMLDDRLTESSTDNNAPVWNSVLNEASWRLYLGDLYGSSEIPVYAAAGRAENFTSLPPACLYVGTIEPFYDETMAYIDKLKANNIPVHVKIFEGCFHGFDQLCADTAVAKEAIAFLMESFNYAVKNYFAAQTQTREENNVI